MKAKEKTYSRKKLVQKACSLIQKYARLRDTDENGYGICSSCGNTVHYNTANGGHFHPKTKAYNGACIMEENVNIQCVKCNLYEQGNIAHYAVHLQNKYGRKIIEKIKEQANKSLGIEELLQFIEYIQPKIKELAKKKTFEVK